VPVTIRELSRKIHDREISPVELTGDCLARIEKLNPTLNAFIAVTSESALDEARRANRKYLTETIVARSTAFPSD